ncbi:hypothetical protein INR49_027831 [Caranx melampygus]|nr:hypothetical protein INR49_027831 [Caranx melampygus]
MIASLSRGSLLDEVLHGSSNEQQLAAYVSWVNSQLKRKPGLKPITDLRHDLQDGVVLTQLIEIVDIVDGNLKSLMRIILALAAHFKPSANHRAASGSGRSSTKGYATHNPLSTIALAQGAAAALASARFDASQPTRVTPESSHVVEETPWEDPLGETLEKEVQETRKMVSALQALLLHGSLPEDEQDVPVTLDPCNAEQQLVVIRSRLDQSMEEAQELKDAQQQRLCTQEASILQMKQELLRASMTKDELNNQNISTSTENNGYSYSGDPALSVSGAEEVQLLRDALRSLRNNFRDHDPQHHTLDTLEQGIVTLKDVKAAVDRQGNYRYHFKALDPEFGTVKEEVFLDGAIVPGWEGKIVAWVEEDRGDERGSLVY